MIKRCSILIATFITYLFSVSFSNNHNFKNECPFCRNIISPEKEEESFDEAENEYNDIEFEMLGRHCFSIFSTCCGNKSVARDDDF